MKKLGRFWVLLVPALLMLQSCRHDVDLKEFSKGNTLEVLKEKGCYKTYSKDPTYIHYDPIRQRDDLRHDLYRGRART